MPSLDAVVVSYIAPFASRSRPIVLPMGTDIKIRVLDKNQDCIVILDGQVEYRMKSTDEIVIKTSENYAEFILFKRSFFDRVHEKLVKNVVN
jgi:NAD+ kinase